MTYRSKAHRPDPAPPHPLEKVVQVVSADSFEDDSGTREDAWAHKVRRDLEAKLAALRRQLSATPSPQRRVTRVSAELRALDRGALLARLAVVRRDPEVRIAHLELSGLTTEDLRLLIAELEATDRTQELPK